MRATLIRDGLKLASLLCALALAGCAAAPGPPSGPELSVSALDSSFAFGGSADGFTVSTVDSGGKLTATIRIHGACELKAAYLELRYDPAQLSPLSAQANGLLANSASSAGLIQLAILDQPGVVTLGEVLPQPQSRAGITGDGELGTVVFARRPFTAARRASQTTRSHYSQAQLAINAAGNLLTWGYYSAGDYDQNGLVTISDLTPIAVHWQETGPFDPATATSAVDGDGNGLIAITDLAPIGGSFSAKVSGYNVYRSMSASDYPASASAVSVGTPLGSVDFSVHTGKANTDRLGFSFNTTATPNAYYWVRPTDGTEEGTPSTLVQFIPPNQLPTVSLSVNPDNGVAPLNVTFTATATDSDGTIAKFEWDLNGDGTYDLDTGLVPTAPKTYNSAGTANASVRVTDNSGGQATASASVLVAPAGSLAPVAILLASPRYGPVPLAASFDATGSTDADSSIVRFQFDYENDGSFDQDSNSPLASHSYPTAGVFDCHLLVTDNTGLTSDAYMLVMPTADAGFPPDDSIFALPSQSFARTGDTIAVELYCKNTANSFQYLNGARLTYPNTCSYVSDSLNAGVIGGAQWFCDGIWGTMGATMLINFPPSFVQETDLGGGLTGLDLTEDPTDGSDVTSASGALVSVKLRMGGGVGTVHFGFQRADASVDRTYYTSATSSNQYWNHDDNAGLPGVSILP